MHLLNIEQRSIDGTAQAVDLDQSPADIVALSFTDSDLSLLASAWEADQDRLPSLRLATLSSLQHPYSVDLYLEKVASRAKFILVRLLGGKDYWRYGVDELANLAQARGIHLAILPGDHCEDARLDEASTLEPEDLRQLWSCFSAGGVANISTALRSIASKVAGNYLAPMPVAMPPFGEFTAACHKLPADAPHALIVFYRAWLLGGDTAPVIALAAALGARGCRVTSVYVTSLKDQASAAPLSLLLDADKPDVILNLTAFSAQQPSGDTVLDRAAVPVLQLALSGGDQPQWEASQRGLGPADLAMNVVLPELDGRIFAGAISFKGEAQRHDSLEFTRFIHTPVAAAIAHAADLALAWARLRRTPRAARRLACVLSDYPAKAGRIGYAVGLDTPRSVVGIAAYLASEGFATALPGDEAALLAALTASAPQTILSQAAYQALLATLPVELQAQIQVAWGAPEDDPAWSGDGFELRFLRAENLLIAVQPDRGAPVSRKADYHNPNLPPRHAYVAFYLWLRQIEQVDAVIHCGTHGTLEWLPGKAVALSATCAPQALLGPVPLIYPFIVNNPGEAAQSKRRNAAVTIGHLAPPLRAAGTHGATAEIEGLFDEYSEAQAIDQRRAALLAELIIERALQTGLATESGIAADLPAGEALLKLDAWLCDIKDMRIGDGLHVFGTSPPEPQRRESAALMARLGAAGLGAAGLAAAGEDAVSIENRIAECGPAELRGLLTALDGGFVPPGPAGAPARGRTDILPTGRNLFSIDPRAVPTRTAWEIGQRTANEFLRRYVQDHGDWPQRVVLDLWGSATMRTGGDDLAQAFALLGLRPSWDAGANRVSGFEILPLAILNRPRIDVTLRISGLFRDVFPSQIALFDAAVRAVAALQEAPEDNPLAATTLAGDTGQRVFGGAPGTYGAGVRSVLEATDFEGRDAVGAAYLAASSHAYGQDGQATAAAQSFRDRVAKADSFIHVQDMPGQDVLDADAFAAHEGGFAAAAALLGNSPAMYHTDTTLPGQVKIRTLREEVARVLRARATNPAWLAGQMRHGYRGATEIAETLDNFFAFAAMTEVTESYQFDLLFDATLGDETVRNFLASANPAALRGMAERFAEADRRGYWKTRRNSASPLLDMLREAAA